MDGSFPTRACCFAHQISDCHPKHSVMSLSPLICSYGPVSYLSYVPQEKKKGQSSQRLVDPGTSKASHPCSETQPQRILQTCMISLAKFPTAPRFLFLIWTARFGRPWMQLERSRHTEGMEKIMCLMGTAFRSRYTAILARFSGQYVNVTAKLLWLLSTPKRPTASPSFENVRMIHGILLESWPFVEKKMSQSTLQIGMLHQNILLQKKCMERKEAHSPKQNGLLDQGHTMQLAATERNSFMLLPMAL
jgi:hypothetical protein